MLAKYLICCLVAALVVSQAQALKRICYYSNYWLPITSIDAFVCDHYIFAFAFIEDHDIVEKNPGDFFSSPRSLQAFVNYIREQNPAAKIMISVRGPNSEFSRTLSHPSHMQTFANNAVRFLRQRDMYGLDVDFEYPGTGGSILADRERFTTFIWTIRRTFNNHPTDDGRLRLSAFMPGGNFNWVNSLFQVNAVSLKVDWLNIGMYDMGGALQNSHHKTVHHSPLHNNTNRKKPDFSVEMAVQVYKNSFNVPSWKIVAGFPLYGRGFTLEESSERGLGAPASELSPPWPPRIFPGHMRYYEVCLMIQEPGAIVTRDAQQKVPFATLDTTWIGYDDPTSLALKVKFVKRKHLGGYMTWVMHDDDTDGSHCGAGPYPLLRRMAQEAQTGTGGAGVIDD